MRKAVSPLNAPAALGPYSQAIDTEGMVFCSGQVGIDPATKKLADGIEAQTEQALTPQPPADWNDEKPAAVYEGDPDDFSERHPALRPHQVAMSGASTSGSIWIHRR